MIGLEASLIALPSDGFGAALLLFCVRKPIFKILPDIQDFISNGDF